MAIRELKVNKVLAFDEGENGDWWSDLTAEEQTQYLKDHPNSRKAKEKKGEDQPKALKPVRDYKPDVDHDSTGDGITDAARVGLAGNVVPPPGRVPRLPNLSEKEKAVEEKFAADFESDPEKITDDFYAMVLAGKKPPTFGTDDAKMLASEWVGEPIEDRSSRRATLNIALHQTANAVAKRAFLKHLDTLKKGDSIMVTVGGCGAGKGYSLGNVDIAKKAASESQAVWDSAGDQNATENPWLQKEAEKRGLTVTYVFVNAEPEVSWADPARGVIKRANNPEDGRMVDAHVFADSYAIGAKNHAAFAEKNKNNPNAKFIYIDSAGKPPTLVDKMPESALKVDRHALTTFALNALEKSDAPPHIKQGGSVGVRIWGKPKETSMSRLSPKRTLAQVDNSAVKYSWDKYVKDEIDHLKALEKDPHAGTYGGGHKNKKEDEPKKATKTKEQKSSLARSFSVEAFFRSNEPLVASLEQFFETADFNPTHLELPAEALRLGDQVANALHFDTYTDQHQMLKGMVAFMLCHFVKSKVGNPKQRIRDFIAGLKTNSPLLQRTLDNVVDHYATKEFPWVKDETAKHY